MLSNKKLGFYVWSLYLTRPGNKEPWWMPSETILACSGMPVKLMFLLGGSSLRWEFTTHQGLLNEPKQDHWPSFQQNENFCTFVGTRRDDNIAWKHFFGFVLFLLRSKNFGTRKKWRYDNPSLRQLVLVTIDTLKFILGHRESTFGGRELILGHESRSKGWACNRA